MLEFLDDRGLAMVTSGKKILSWLYRNVTSLPLYMNTSKYRESPQRHSGPENFAVLEDVCGDVEGGQ